MSGSTASVPMAAATGSARRNRPRRPNRWAAAVTEITVDTAQNQATSDICRATYRSPPAKKVSVSVVTPVHSAAPTWTSASTAANRAAVARAAAGVPAARVTGMAAV
jgi:hypothetical protein